MVAYPGVESHSRSARRLNEPRPARVVAAAGAPAEVDRTPVELVREEWRVLDRWWTEEPVQRRYFEVVLANGRNVVVFEDELTSAWFRQRA